MKQGTVSILFGCHSLFHSYLVLLSWIKLYKKFPHFYELVCIFLHDIGHYNLNYLDSVEEKNKHWKLGAKIAKFLFSNKGFNLIASHDANSGYSKSKLYYSDKYSWYLAPKIWLFSNCIFEPKISMGYTYQQAVKLFKERVKINIESGEFSPTHNFYLDRCQKKEDKN